MISYERTVKMILLINQVTANGANNFQIYSGGQLMFMGSAPFFKPSALISGNVSTNLVLTDTNGSVIFYTRYDPIENLGNAVIPLSWMFKDSKKVRIYEVLDRSGNKVGAFYHEQTGLADRKLVLQYGSRMIACYLKEAGKKEVVSVYDGETQIGQITKPNYVYNNLDQYLAHFTNDFPFPEIVSFFVIYYDFIFHNHSGEIMTGYRVNVTHTFDKNEKRFNKKFIAENFGKEEDDRVEQFIKDTYNLRKKKKR